MGCYFRGAEADLDGAQAAHRGVPTRRPLDQVNPGQQVLDTQTKLVTHAIRIAAFNIDTALARAVRRSTGYARADDEAHNLFRQALLYVIDVNMTIPFAARLIVTSPAQRIRPGPATDC